MLSRMVLAAVMVIGVPTLLQAQHSSRQRPNSSMQPVEIQGTIQNAGRGGIMVLDQNTNVTWRVAIMTATATTPATKIQVTGATTADALRSGLIVEFIAEIDAQGAIHANVGDLTVTSLTAQKQVGMFPPEAIDGSDDLGGAGLQKPKSDKAARAHGKTAAGTTAAGKYRIVGKLIVGRGHALSVQPGRGALPFTLADDATIKVDMSDLSAVSRGNTVTVNGATNRPGYVWASQVKVTLPEPPGGAKKAEKPKDKPASPKKDKD